MAVIFNQVVRHARLELMPDVPLAFEDSGAEEYFVKAGWAEKTTKKPVRTYQEGEAPIDPLTRFGETGAYVQPEVAKAHLAEHDGNPPPAPHELAFNSGLIAPAPEA